MRHTDAAPVLPIADFAIAELTCETSQNQERIRQLAPKFADCGWEETQGDAE